MVSIVPYPLPPNEEAPVSLINTQILPFKATAYRNGEFVDVSDEDLKGKWSVVFFYPADFTFVCPTELGDLADNYETFQKLGVVKPWPNQKDLGRYAVTKAAKDKMMFKTPSLRNIAMTAPYYHDGSVKTLEEAVSLMAEYQNGKKLAPAETASIVAFLKTLTGELPMDYIRKPVLPASTPRTPKPDLTE